MPRSYLWPAVVQETVLFQLILVEFNGRFADSIFRFRLTVFAKGRVDDSEISKRSEFKIHESSG